MKIRELWVEMRRAAREVVLRVVDAVLRVLWRVLPGLTHVLEILASDIHTILRNINRSGSSVVSLRVGEVRFRLSLVEEHPSAQIHYTRLAREDEVLEPVMVACLNRVLLYVGEPCFVDVGAFMGYYACYVAARFQDRYRVYAIESNPGYCTAIWRSIALNGFSRIGVYNVALVDRSDTLWASGETVHGRGGQGVSVRGVTLDELCEEAGFAPNIVKIDVHGAEGKVVLGMREMMRKYVEFILLELHPSDYIERYSGDITRREILFAMEQGGFHNFYVAGHRYRRSDGLRYFLDTGRLAFRPLSAETMEDLLFDRHVDIFVLASKVAEIERVLGPSVLDVSLLR